VLIDIDIYWSVDAAAKSQIRIFLRITNTRLTVSKRLQDFGFIDTYAGYNTQSRNDNAFQEYSFDFAEGLTMKFAAKTLGPW